MDNEKDLFIKKELEKDELISKKADDVFNNFFKEEIKMEEKIENINSSKDKKINNKRKILVTAAMLLVVFLSANVYAATKGYNNIFFIIRNLITHEKITDKNEILSDKDILISYQSIEIAENLYMQVNNLVIKDNEGTLKLKIIERDGVKKYPYKYLVYNLDTNEELGNQKTTRKDKLKGIEFGEYYEEIKLTKMTENTKKIQLKIEDDDNQNIITLNINLENKEIDIINGMEAEMKKISEVELKNVLNKYAHLNFTKNFPGIVDDQDYSNEVKILVATELIKEQYYAKYPDTQDLPIYDAESVHKAIKEFIGEDIEEPIKNLNGITSIKYNKTKKCYEYENGEPEISNPMCLQIDNITFNDGIYTVTYIYSYYEDEMELENLSQYISTMQFKLNENYEYTKYCLVNVDEITSELYKEYEESDYNEIINEDDIFNALSNYARINFFEDHNSVSQYYTDEECRNEVKVLIAMDYIEKKYGSKVYFEKDLVHLAIEELTGQSYIEPISLANIVVEYNAEKAAYEYISRNHAIYSEVAGVSNTELDNRRSSITFTYNYPKSNLKDTLFTATIKLTENENYEFIKYRIEDVDSFRSTVNEFTDDDIFTTINTNTENTIDTSKVDNYASSMEWASYWSPGIKLLYPAEWNLEVISDSSDGSKTGAIATGISGVATGINKETNTIVNSDVVISVYEPEFIQINSLDEYIKYIERCSGGKESGSFNADKSGEWFEIHSYWTGLEDGTRHIVDYFHYESTSENQFGINYRIRMYSNNHENFKLINIMNKFMSELSMTSF